MVGLRVRGSGQGVGGGGGSGVRWVMGSGVR